MKNKNFIYLFVFILSSISASAQLAMGKWRTHLAYNNVTQIAQTDNKIFAVSDGALFSVDKLCGTTNPTDNGCMEFYSKVSGLNGSNITNIEYDASSKQLLILYANGNIDLHSSGGIINVPDLYNKQMSASKAVNNIQFYDNKAYLSCDFGIVVLNMLRNEVADTYIIGANATELKILSTTVLSDSIYAITASDIYRASAKSTTLVNYQNWKTIPNLPGSGNLQSVISFASKLFLLRGGKVWYKGNDNIWTAFRADLTVTNINTFNGVLNVFAGSTICSVDNSLTSKDITGIGALTDAEYDSNNQAYWFAAQSQGVLLYKQIGSDAPLLNYFQPASPAQNSPFEMTFAGEKLFVVPGGRWTSQNFTPGVVMIFENGKWTNIKTADIAATTNSPVMDFMNVAVDPNDKKHFFVTSYGTGLFEFKNDAIFKLHNESNSTINSIYPGNPNYMRLDGAIYDKNGNLYVVNTSMLNNIKILLANGTWTQSTYPSLSLNEFLGKMLISNLNQNQKAVIGFYKQSVGVYFFDDNGTITDQSDDKSIGINSFKYMETDANNNQIQTSVTPVAVLTLVQDKNGVIWVGTTEGPFLFNNLSNVYSPDYVCSRVKIPRNDGSNNADYLLKDTEVKTIAIDGANRKWLGTKTSGVYLLSENGQETIEHFTSSNSPLLSNNIQSLAINPVTGEVFIGTDKGIISYQSDASEAGASFGNVYAYPNPVRQGYNGVITITGLIENSQVKITDLSGNLICQTISNGSLATWDGKDVHGRKVSTGIYLAIATSQDGTQSTTTKIMVIN